MSVAIDIGESITINGVEFADISENDLVDMICDCERDILATEQTIDKLQTLLDRKIVEVHGHEA